MNDATEPVLVLTTWPDPQAAERAAADWVERRLAACVALLPAMTSVYRWEGAVERAREHQLLVKTRRGVLDALQQAIREAHPYELPEILVLSVTGGLPEYLDWIRQCTD